jgi:PTS system nitrogen regulatory IIA component
MNVVDLLAPERIVHRSAVDGKNGVLAILSERLATAAPGTTRAEVFNSLCSRESLGSTGLGHGVAVPHGRIADANEAVGALVKLEHAVNYDAPDGEPVDIVFALLVPEGACDQHLELLSQLAGIFSNRRLLADLRATGSSRETFALLKREVAVYAV